MQTLATLFRTAQFTAHNAHNLIQGDTFFEDHEFLGELYGTYEEAYDGIIERMIGLGIDFDLQEILQESAMRAGANLDLEDPTDAFNLILRLEQSLCTEIANLNDEASLGTQNLLGGLADESEVRQYKLKQRLG